MKIFKPMLLSTAKQPFNNKDFLFEFKFDGVRMLAYINNQTKLISRSLKDKTNIYPEITQNLNIESNTILDGEMIAVVNGKDNFGAIMQRENANINKTDNLHIVYVVFDILHYKGKSLLNTPLLQRKQILENVVINNNHVQKATYVIENGKNLFLQAKNNNMEGIVAKNINSFYYPNTRTANWIKIKHTRQIEAYICGYIQKSQISLCLGEFINGKLTYIGQVGNGLKTYQWEQLKKALDLIRDSNPFTQDIQADVFCKPLLKVKVSYLNRTENNLLRMPIIEQILVE